MCSRIWGTAGNNGEIEIVSLTNDKLEESLNILRTEFYAHESVCKAIQLVKNERAVKSLDPLLIDVAKLGCSLIAKEKNSDKVVGISLNNLQEKDDNLISFFERYSSTMCTEEESRAFMQFMVYVDGHLSYFNHCNITCLLEIMFLSIHSGLQGKGIAKALCAASIEFARRLKNGENVKVSLIDDKPLPLEPLPQIVAAIFTSSVSQKLGKAFGFTKAAEIDYNDYSYKGVPYKTLIGPNTSSMTIEYLRL